MNRRSLITGIGSLLVMSPAVVRASSLMPIYPLDPDWIANHHDHPIFGQLVVRLRNARNLDQFRGIIQPRQFFWRQGERLIDICVFPQTRLDITPGMFSVRNVTGESKSVDFGQPKGVGMFSELHLYAPGLMTKHAPLIW